MDGMIDASEKAIDGRQTVRHAVADDGVDDVQVVT